MRYKFRRIRRRRINEEEEAAEEVKTGNNRIHDAVSKIREARAKRESSTFTDKPRKMSTRGQPDISHLRKRKMSRRATSCFELLIFFWLFLCKMH